MLVKVHCSARAGRVWLVGAALTATLAGCGSPDGASSRIARIVMPYKVDVVQGNFVSREQVEALQPGMGRQQVREILGTPLVTSLFHADRWEYVFTLKRPGEDMQTRKLTVFFKGDVLERSEGDAMPSETEFVATLGARDAQGQAPALEATPEQLARYPAAPRQPASDAQPAAAPSPGTYPPLEAPVR
ncbi:outer membrane protein assembly factor BamE [Verminephrobacter aporrectodeae subsp. tuberculatae]|uniref:Outer membrane protein assembly factor BamE n=1 Tax=Verminephrobacter aporrectodeae subsp. tuberculatae TaxID=1110392 RepID=A0ABT3KSZ9_9BURK|nr:outer membrane protein assembly factor BamE [Verminephrobacter aporrectodeae]MCW5321450.1 outer membrane protein assembly factor BamE [Verminephrobacter aporrectodeae subsp. tuberculatae]